MGNNDPLYDSDEFRRNARQASSDVRWSLWKIIIPTIILLMVVGVIIDLVGRAVNAGDEAADVAQQQFGAKALLAKYEWFKDASAQLDSKKATIALFEQRENSLEKDYKGKTRDQWARDDREQYDLYVQEEDGLKASFNTLAADYNSQMSKFNWRFANQGQLPQGVDTPLPREYKAYLAD